MDDLTPMTPHVVPDLSALFDFASTARKFAYDDTAFVVDGFGDGFLVYLDGRTAMARSSDVDAEPVEVDRLFLPVTVIFMPVHTRPGDARAATV